MTHLESLDITYIFSPRPWAHICIIEGIFHLSDIEERLHEYMADWIWNKMYRAIQARHHLTPSFVNYYPVLYVNSKSDLKNFEFCKYMHMHIQPYLAWVIHHFESDRLLPSNSSLHRNNNLKGKQLSFTKFRLSSSSRNGESDKTFY